MSQTGWDERQVVASLPVREEGEFELLDQVSFLCNTGPSFFSRL